MKLIIDMGKGQRPLATQTDIPVAIITVAKIWNVETTFAAHMVNIARSCPELEAIWTERKLSQFIGDLTLLAIQRKADAGKMHLDIIHRVSIDNRDRFNEQWFSPRPFTEEETNMLALMAGKMTTNDVEGINASIWAFVKILHGGSLGARLAIYCAKMYDDYIAGKRDIMTVVRELCSDTATSSMMLHMLRLDDQLCEMYELRAESLRTSPQHVVIATAIAIDAKSEADALAQLETSMVRVKDELKQKLMHAWQNK